MNQLPIPVYGLLMADVQWAGLGLTRQQQLRSGSAGSDISSTTITTTNAASPGIFATRHTLVYLSTGTMNILRNGAIPMPYNITQPVANQKLDDLLTMWDFMNSSLNFRARQSSSGSLGSGAGGGPNPEISEAQRAREEINLGISELHLDNRAFGPLIVPGPCKPFGNRNNDKSNSNDSSSEGESESKNDTAAFNYHAGWPVLNEVYTQSALQEAVHPTVKDIRALRGNYEKQVSAVTGLAMLS